MIVCMRGKRGWIRILEATIAVLIVSATMMAVYSHQPFRGTDIGEFSYSLQKQILEDIAMNSSLRLAVMRVKDDVPGDSDYDRLNKFVGDRIPSAYGYLIKICDLGNLTDYCKMDYREYVATRQYDIYVEEIMISAELGAGGEDVSYMPRKVRMFFWEGGFPEYYCRDECLSEENFLICSDDSRSVLNKSCGNFDDDDCLEWNFNVNTVDACDANEVCRDGKCVDDGSGWFSLVCEDRSARVVMFDKCTKKDPEVLCANYNGYNDLGKCGAYHWFRQIKDKYECWNYARKNIECSANPSCPDGMELVERKECSTPASKVGKVSLGFSNVRYDWSAPYHYYYHDRTFVESGGVGVTLTSGKLCSQVSGCKSYTINYKIKANSQLVLNNQNFYTEADSETFTLIYNGIDDNGKSVSVPGVVVVNRADWISP